jgi:TetR/AcrR family transcriptional repressor of lmrAB and yxaGH operons
MDNDVTQAKARTATGPLVLGARERLVDATIDLLRQGGLAAAGLNEVVDRAQAPKGSLYHYFPGGKAELVVAALAVYASRVDQRLDLALSAPTSLLARSASVFEATAEAMAAQHFNQSCAVGTVTLDLGLGEADALARSGAASGATRGLREACSAALTSWSHTVAKHLPELAPAARPAVGRNFITLLEGAQLMARAQRHRQPLDDARDTFVALLQAQPLRRAIS